MEYHHAILDSSLEYSCNVQRLKSGSTLQKNPEGIHIVCEGLVRVGKRSFLLIFRGDKDLKVSRKPRIGKQYIHAQLQAFKAHSDHERKTSRSLVFLTVDNADEMTIGSWLFSWRKAYSRCLGNSFNSSLGGSTLDGFSRFFKVHSIRVVPPALSSALAVVRKGLPKMIRTGSSSSISKTTKSTGKMNLVFFHQLDFLHRPLWGIMSRSIRLVEYTFLVGLSLEIPNRRKREYGMRFMLAPKSARAFLTAKGRFFSVSPSVELSVAGRGEAGKGESCVLIPNLVVMAKVGDSGLGVSLLLIVERIWEYCSCNSLRCWTSISPILLRETSF
ncbi:hypothetical protein Tco_0561225 [Tanacetum coccineum]